MRNQAFSKIWVVVIAIIFLAGGIFAWQYFGAPREEVKVPEEVGIDETANWKTYRNEEYGFEFKYPPIPSECPYCKIDESGDVFNAGLTSLTAKDLRGLTLSQFVDSAIKEFEIEKKESISIADREGIKVDYRIGGTGRYGSTAFVEKDRKVLVFEFMSGAFCCGPGVDRIYEDEIYQAMLSTIRFIEKKIGEEIVEGDIISITYTSENLAWGYSFTQIKILGSGDFNYTRKLNDEVKEKFDGQLSDTELKELSKLILSGEFFNLPEDLSGPAGCADAPTESLKIVMKTPKGEITQAVGGYCIVDESFLEIIGKIYELIKR